MKKNTMMRVASVLLVAVLLSTCVISSTFAKYVSEFENSDNARVAAWGFGNSTTIDFELFSTSYGDDVASKNGSDNVIAPGTSQTEMVKLNYANTTSKGAPEVDYTIDINIVDAETSIGTNIKSNTNILWSFNGTTFQHTNEKSSWDLMIEAIEAYHENVEANNLPTITNTGIAIGWEWAFSEVEADNVKDTALGDAASLETVKLTIEIVATQVNTTPVQP